MTALFTIVESYRADLDALNAMDIDAATYADTLDGMQGELQDKLRAVIAYSLDLEIEATGAAAASKRMKERAKNLTLSEIHPHPGDSLKHRVVITPLRHDRPIVQQAVRQSRIRLRLRGVGRHVDKPLRRVHKIRGDGCSPTPAKTWLQTFTQDLRRGLFRSTVIEFFRTNDVMSQAGYS